MEHVLMKMKDWVLELDDLLKKYWKWILENSWKISHKKAIQKAEEEYKKFQVKTLSSGERDYIEALKEIEKKGKKLKKK
jgi:hypothetical protein